MSLSTSSKILFYLSAALGDDLFVTKETNQVLVKIVKKWPELHTHIPS